MNKSWRLNVRVIAALLAVLFTFSELSYAAPFEPSSVSTAPSIAQDAIRFEAPLDFVQLKEISKGHNGKLIIHIQDAHSNTSGQENLANALDAIMKKYGTRLVLSEGGQDDCSLTPIKKIANASVWKRVAKNYLMQGKISGEEYLNLVSDHPMKIMGLENMDLYLKSVQNYAELADKRGQVLRYLAEIHSSLEKIKQKIYPKQLLEYEAGRPQADGAQDYDKLLELAQQANLNLNAYPNAQKWVELKLQEKLIDFNMANLEQGALMEQLLKTGIGDSLKQELDKVSRLKNSKISQSAYFTKTFDIARSKGILIEKYPGLIKYTEYLQSFAEMDIEALLDEMQKIENEVYAAQMKEADSKLVRAVDRYLNLLVTAYKIQMTTKEFALFKANEKDFLTPAYLAFINRKLAELGYFEDLTAYENSLERGKTALENFYQSVSDRDEVFLRNTEKILAQENENVAVLISGGYHTPHLKKLFLEKGYSMIVLTPFVTSETNQQKYEKLLLSPIRKDTKKFTSIQGESRRIKSLSALEGDLAKSKTARVMALQTEFQRNPVGSRLAEMAQEVNPERADEVLSGLSRMPTSVGGRLASEKIDVSKAGYWGVDEELNKQSKILALQIFREAKEINPEAEVDEKLTEGSPAWYLSRFIYELLTNALVHGNAMDFKQPISMSWSFPDGGKVIRIEVIDTALATRLQGIQKIIYWVKKQLAHYHLRITGKKMAVDFMNQYGKHQLIYKRGANNQFIEGRAVFEAPINVGQTQPEAGVGMAEAKPPTNQLQLAIKQITRAPRVFFIGLQKINLFLGKRLSFYYSKSYGPLFLKKSGKYLEVHILDLDKNPREIIKAFRDLQEDIPQLSRRYKGLIGLTSHPALIRVAKKYGFTASPNIPKKYWPKVWSSKFQLAVSKLFGFYKEMSLREPYYFLSYEFSNDVGAPALRSSGGASHLPDGQGGRLAPNEDLSLVEAITIGALISSAAQLVWNNSLSLVFIPTALALYFVRQIFSGGFRHSDTERKLSSREVKRLLSEAPAINGRIAVYSFPHRGTSGFVNMRLVSKLIVEERLKNGTYRAIEYAGLKQIVENQPFSGARMAKTDGDEAAYERLREFFNRRNVNVKEGLIAEVVQLSNHLFVLSREAYSAEELDLGGLAVELGELSDLVGAFSRRLLSVPLSFKNPNIIDADKQFLNDFSEIFFIKNGRVFDEDMKFLLSQKAYSFEAEFFPERYPLFNEFLEILDAYQGIRIGNGARLSQEMTRRAALVRMTQALTAAGGIFAVSLFPAPVQAGKEGKVFKLFGVPIDDPRWDKVKQLGRNAKVSVDRFLDHLALKRHLPEDNPEEVNAFITAFENTLENIEESSRPALLNALTELAQSDFFSVKGALRMSVIAGITLATGHNAVWVLPVLKAVVRSEVLDLVLSEKISGILKELFVKDINSHWALRKSRQLELLAQSGFFNEAAEAKFEKLQAIDEASNVYAYEAIAILHDLETKGLLAPEVWEKTLGVVYDFIHVPEDLRAALPAEQAIKILSQLPSLTVGQSRRLVTLRNEIMDLRRIQFTQRQDNKRGARLAALPSNWESLFSGYIRHPDLYADINTLEKVLSDLEQTLSKDMFAGKENSIKGLFFALAKNLLMAQFYVDTGLFGPSSYSKKDSETERRRFYEVFSRLSSIAQHPFITQSPELEKELAALRRDPGHYSTEAFRQSAEYASARLRQFRHLLRIESAEKLVQRLKEISPSKEFYTGLANIAKELSYEDKFEPVNYCITGPEVTEQVQQLQKENQEYTEAYQAMRFEAGKKFLQVLDLLGPSEWAEIDKAVENLRRIAGPIADYAKNYPFLERTLPELRQQFSESGPVGARLTGEIYVQRLEKLREQLTLIFDPTDNQVEASKIKAELIEKGFKGENILIVRFMGDAVRELIRRRDLDPNTPLVGLVLNNTRRFVTYGYFSSHFAYLQLTVEDYVDRELLAVNPQKLGYELAPNLTAGNLEARLMEALELEEGKSAGARLANKYIVEDIYLLNQPRIKDFKKILLKKHGTLSVTYLGFLEGSSRPLYIKVIKEKAFDYPYRGIREALFTKILSENSAFEKLRAHFPVYKGGDKLTSQDIEYLQQQTAVQDFGEGAIYFILDEVSGEPLHEYLDDAARGIIDDPQSTFSAISALQDLIELADLFENMHQAGVYHRDASPQELFRPKKKEDKWKVIDFGVSVLDRPDLPETNGRFTLDELRQMRAIRYGNAYSGRSIGNPIIRDNEVLFRIAKAYATSLSVSDAIRPYLLHLRALLRLSGYRTDSASIHIKDYLSALLTALKSQGRLPEINLHNRVVYVSDELGETVEDEGPSQGARLAAKKDIEKFIPGDLNLAHAQLTRMQLENLSEGEKNLVERIAVFGEKQLQTGKPLQLRFDNKDYFTFISVSRDPEGNFSVIFSRIDKTEDGSELFGPPTPIYEYKIDRDRAAELRHEEELSSGIQSSATIETLQSNEDFQVLETRHERDHKNKLVLQILKNALADEDRQALKPAVFNLVYEDYFMNGYPNQALLDFQKNVEVMRQFFGRIYVEIVHENGEVIPEYSETVPDDVRREAQHMLVSRSNAQNIQLANKLNARFLSIDPKSGEFPVFADQAVMAIGILIARMEKDEQGNLIIPEGFAQAFLNLLPVEKREEFKQNISSYLLASINPSIEDMEILERFAIPRISKLNFNQILQLVGKQLQAVGAAA